MDLVRTHLIASSHETTTCEHKIKNIKLRDFRDGPMGQRVSTVESCWERRQEHSDVIKPSLAFRCLATLGLF